MNIHFANLLYNLRNYMYVIVSINIKAILIRSEAKLIHQFQLRFNVLIISDEEIITDKIVNYRGKVILRKI